MTNEKKSSKPFNQPTDDEISVYAYHLWEADGRQHGRDVDYWLQAKAHMIADRQYEAGLLPSRPTTPKTATQKTAVALIESPEESAAKANKKKKSETPRATVRQAAFV